MPLGVGRKLWDEGGGCKDGVQENASGGIIKHHGKRNVVAFPRAPTRWRCISIVVFSILPYLTSMEKQIIEVMQGLAQIISMMVRPPFSYNSSGA